MESSTEDRTFPSAVIPKPGVELRKCTELPGQVQIQKVWRMPRNLYVFKSPGGVDAEEVWELQL